MSGSARTSSPARARLSADFANSGGIFSNAEVTYRGVTVGKVGQLHIINKGVRVDLELDDCGSPKIPTNTSATIADRSVVGRAVRRPGAEERQGSLRHDQQSHRHPDAAQPRPGADEEPAGQPEGPRPVGAAQRPAHHRLAAVLGAEPARRRPRPVDRLQQPAAGARRWNRRTSTTRSRWIDNSQTVLGTQLDESQPLLELDQEPAPAVRPAEEERPGHPPAARRRPDRSLDRAHS